MISRVSLHRRSSGLSRKVSPAVTCGRGPDSDKWVGGRPRGVAQRYSCASSGLPLRISSLDLTRTPGLVEERSQRVVETKDGEPTLLGVVCSQLGVWATSLPGCASGSAWRGRTRFVEAPAPVPMLNGRVRERVPKVRTFKQSSLIGWRGDSCPRHSRNSPNGIRRTLDVEPRGP